MPNVYSADEFFILGLGQASICKNSFFLIEHSYAAARSWVTLTAAMAKS